MTRQAARRSQQRRVLTRFEGIEKKWRTIEAVFATEVVPDARLLAADVHAPSHPETKRRAAVLLLAGLPSTPATVRKRSAWSSWMPSGIGAHGVCRTEPTLARHASTASCNVPCRRSRPLKMPAWSRMLRISKPTKRSSTGMRQVRQRRCAAVWIPVTCGNHSLFEPDEKRCGLNFKGSGGFLAGRISLIDIDPQDKESRSAMPEIRLQIPHCVPNFSALSTVHAGRVRHTYQTCHRR